MLGFFDAREVKAIVVGAHAVAFHAKPRFTKGRAEGAFGQQRVFYLGRDELIRNKKAAGRPQDQLDLQWLRASKL